MSPQTREARDRILLYLHEHPIAPNTPPPPKQSRMLAHLLDTLIAIARSDPFEDPN